MLVFSAFMPYLPFDSESADENQVRVLKKTLEACRILEENLYARQPDTVIFITKHGDMLPDAFSASMNDHFVTGFGELGDFEAGKRYSADIPMIQRIKEKIMPLQPFVLFSEEVLPYTASGPIHLILSKQPEVRIVPLYYSLRDNQDHVAFGSMLREVIEEGSKRVAVIAVGTLSHCVTKKGPGKYRPEGKLFDQKILNILKDNKTTDALQIDQTLVDRAQECGYKPLLTLFGLLENYDYQTDLLSYEYPFGVGYLTAEFKLG